MDIFSSRLPILKTCATLPRSEITGSRLNVQKMADLFCHSGCAGEKQTMVTFGDALHNGSIINLWQTFLSRSMPSEKQAQAVQCADAILRLNMPKELRLKDVEFVPTIEQFCAIDLAYTSLEYAEKQLNTMLALSSQNKLNPIFNPYLMGRKNLILETDENQNKLNQTLLTKKIEPNEHVQKTIDYWWENVPVGILHTKLYGVLQEDLVKVLIGNRFRVLGDAIAHDHKVEARHPQRCERLACRSWRGRE